ncbi:MAG TPA: bifunctional adenosylcobinamide kinase/adenosylcobinamide-phosphate guanylyltransferase [Anaerolineae bacterium]|nr:bifunctional adenosylcobinamide kinase/adenosylcobinamide-phosphate guanylyltransferase [Caldilineae bacterium]HID33086.1 bifunctional adenosylcobinamide kinase/adenosylcobinamide-phosphate guanylyltransferase [Anaerolineae bacterium]
MSHLTLILGGARSGKSTYAEMLARQWGGDDVLYIATAQALDDDMRSRIEAHRAQRPASWRTLEAPLHPGRVLLSQRPPEPVFLLDCLTLLVSNILLAHNGDVDAAQEAVDETLDDLLVAMRALNVRLILVSNEVGMGLVPDNALGRAYRDLLGRANQRMAQAADEVIFMVAGLPLALKEDLDMDDRCRDGDRH